LGGSAPIIGVTTKIADAASGNLREIFVIQFLSFILLAPGRDETRQAEGLPGQL
jgi:hypothetical protein